MNVPFHVFSFRYHDYFNFEVKTTLINHVEWISQLSKAQIVNQHKSQSSVTGGKEKQKMSVQA